MVIMSSFVKAAKRSPLQASELTSNASSLSFFTASSQEVVFFFAHCSMGPSREMRIENDSPLCLVVIFIDVGIPFVFQRGGIRFGAFLVCSVLGRSIHASVIVMERQQQNVEPHTLDGNLRTFAMILREENVRMESG